MRSSGKVGRVKVKQQRSPPTDLNHSPTAPRHRAKCMSDEPNGEQLSPQRPQFSLRTLFKITTYAAVLIYIVCGSWNHLGFTLFVFLLLSPFIFFAEIVDLLLGAKRG
jgi:hypothetical protein